MSSPNSVTIRPLSRLKQSLVKGGRRPHKVLGGLYRGMVLDLDLKSETQFYLGLYETETFQVIRETAADCRWMIDVGAAAGDLAIFFLRQEKCRFVHAFEPRADSLRRFRRNLGLNGLADDRRLFIHEQFVGIQDHPEYTRLDDLALDINQPGFLKIDVDGLETEVLDSASSLLAGAQLKVLVEVHSEQLESDCIERLRRLSYAVRVIKNAPWRLVIPERRPIPHNRWLWAIKSR